LSIRQVALKFNMTRALNCNYRELRQDTTFDCNFGGVFHDFFFHTKNAQKENRF